MKTNYMIWCFVLLTINICYAQDKKISTNIFEGTVVAGYVDNGAYLNCTGPAIKYNSHGYSIMLGLLPSIKVKKDSAPVKNAMLTPTLGCGATIVLLKHLAIQVPAFYIPKTIDKDGKWKLGFGAGYKF